MILKAMDVMRSGRRFRNIPLAAERKEVGGRTQAGSRPGTEHLATVSAKGEKLRQRGGGVGDGEKWTDSR